MPFGSQRFTPAATFPDPPLIVDQAIQKEENFSEVLLGESSFEAVARGIARTRRSADIVRNWGYRCEEYSVLTADKVVLTIQRILPPRGATQSNTTTLPVILFHGFGGSGNCFVCAPKRDQNLPFFLLDNGCAEVWLANVRGPLYTDFTQRGSREFSIDDIVYHDVPSMIDRVLQVSGNSHIACVGISQGTTSLFGALAVSEELNRKVKLAVLLAPTLKPCGHSISDIVPPLFRYVGVNVGNEVYLNSTQVFKELMPVQVSSKVIAVFTQFGFKWDFTTLGGDARLMPLCAHGYHGTSRDVVGHWLQTIEGDSSFAHFQKQSSWFDMFRAPQATSSPIKYPTKHITAPLHLIYSFEDPITDPEQLRKYLPERTKFVDIPGYSHVDFLWAVDANKLVFEPILNLIQNA
ncbi:cholesterol esterase [Podochytrium sp. JEL0797]|nr:cholesterol esterase [Podochytrium sp. JEL0797]